MRPLASVLFALLCCISLAAPAGDWPRFRGPGGDGVSPETGINKDWTSRPPKQLWKVALTDRGYACIAVAGGKVFIIDHKGKQDILRALSLASGDELWRFSYDDTTTNQFGYARCTPTFDQGRLYLISRLGKLFCIDAAAGKPIWMKDVLADLGGKRPTFAFVAAPLVMGDKLIVMTGGKEGVLCALAKADGKLLWRGAKGVDLGAPPEPARVLPNGTKVPWGAPDSPGYFVPVPAKLNGRDQLLCANGRALISVSPENGETLWSHPWPTVNGNNIADPIVIGDSVLFNSSDDHGAVMLDFPGGKPAVRYHTKALQTLFSAPVLYKGLVYAISDPDGELICMDPKDGKVHWRQKGFERGPVLAVDGAILALDGKGGALALVEATAAGYKELGRFTPLGGQSWTPPVIADGRLLIRNRDALACFDLK